MQSLLIGAGASTLSLLASRAGILPQLSSSNLLPRLGILLSLAWGMAWVCGAVAQPFWRFAVLFCTLAQVLFVSHLAKTFEVSFSGWPLTLCLLTAAGIPEWIRHRAARSTELELDPSFFQPAAFRPSPTALAESARIAASLPPQRVPCTVLYCELVNNSTLADTLPPAACASFLNRLLFLYEETATAHGGRTDRSSSEGFRSVFCTAYGIEEHPEAALHAALAIRGRVQNISQECAVKFGQDLDVRIGVSTGEVLLATFGPAQKQTSSIAGETAEWAQRLAGANMIYGSRILISARTGLLGGHSVERRPIDLLQRHLPPHPPEDVFEVLALQHTLDTETLARLRLYREGVALFRARKWAPARIKLRAARPAGATDEAVDLLLMRIDEQESRATHVQTGA
ncbi:MAG: class 3 [Verrucomicrobia bacterium]|nr:MAG: class 3 [Verrucomicrobiota bacterium]